MSPGPEALIAALGLAPQGPLPWGVPLPEVRPGVYIVSVAAPFELLRLPPDERQRWNEGHSIVYIGRTTSSLRKRLGQFYRHRYGEHSPHRGGQSVKLIEAAGGRLIVHWTATADCASAENQLLELFRHHTGRLPYANRMRSAQPRSLRP